MNRNTGIALLGVFLAVLYAGAVRESTISPEFPLYHYMNAGKTFGAVLAEFGRFDFIWYRPMAAYVPYWIGQHFLDWHNHSGWKVLNLVTVLGCGLGVSWFSLLLFPRRPVGSLARGGPWFVAHPNTFAPAIEGDRV